MGYRGEDASRPWADSRRQQPWPPSEGSPAPAAGPRHAGAWDYEANAEYPSADGYGVYEQGPRPDDHGGQQNYGGPGGPGRYDGPAQPGGPGRHDRMPGPGGPGSYGGGFPDNDWYGDSRSGGFADTSVNARPSIPGGYRPGDYDARPRALGPAPEAVPPGPLHAPSPPADRTARQPAIDDRREAPYPGYDTSYPGYENVDDDQSGNGGYQPQGGYDDYDDFVPSSRSAPTTANPLYTGPPPTTANPVPKELLADGTGRPASLLGSLTSSPKKVMVLSTSALCVIGAFAAIYFFLIKPSDDQAQANSPLPSAGSSAATTACQKKLGEYCHITYRSGDPTPLSVSELYPPAVLNEKDHISFQRIATGTDKTCSNAVLGNSLQSALGSKECSQAVRASYTSGSGKSEVVGTIGVFNLSSTNQAHNAGKLVGTNNFIKPLATNSGTGSVLGQSTGVMEAQFKGHYLILTWAELASEATPTNSDDQKLQQFENDLIASTANISLSQRMVNGKPS